MKRWGIFILTLAMLFAVAGAEEVFMEESFLDAGVQGEEFFSEESFFGDAFEANAPEEDELGAEDRSVYLSESETRPATVLDWQKYFVKVDGAAAGRKINLTWALFTDEACTTPAPAITVGKGAYAGVKFFVYQVDPWTGVAKEKKTTTAFKISLPVKNPGDYIYFVRLENVDKKSGIELLGNPSKKFTVPVAETESDQAISKLKLGFDKDDCDFYTERSYVNPDEITIVTEFEPYFLLYTKKAADAYVITSQMQGGSTYTGCYFPSEQAKEKVFAGYPLSIYLTSVTWKDESPDFISKGKGQKLTITVVPATFVVSETTGEKEITGTIGKPKKASLKLSYPKSKTPSANTPPEIRWARQLDANTLEIEWYDAAAEFNFVTPTAYSITYGKNKVEIPVTQLTPEGKGWFSYKLKDAGPVAKATKMKITVQAKAEGKVKPKKSKAFKVDFLPASMLAIYNPGYNSSLPLRISWMGANPQVTTYQVYLTDSKHTIDVANTTISATKDASNANYNKYNDMYFAEFKAEDYKALQDGRRLGVVIKALAADGVTVLGRMTFDYVPGMDGSVSSLYNSNRRQAAVIEMPAEKAQYTGFTMNPFKLYDENKNDRSSYTIKVSKIVLEKKDGSKQTWDTDTTTPDPDVPSTYYSVIRDPGTYTITAGVKDSPWCKDIEEKDYTFKIEPRTLSISLEELEEGKAYAIVKDDLEINFSFIYKYVNIENGDGEPAVDLYFSTDWKVFKQDKTTEITDKKIREAGSYYIQVTVHADPDNTDGLTPSTDPNPFTKTEMLPITVIAEKKLYLDVTTDETGYVGHFNGPSWRVEDWKGNDVYDSDDTVVTVTAKDEKGTEIKVGDIVRQSGVYTIMITATKEGWIDAEPFTIEVTIYENAYLYLNNVPNPNVPFGQLYFDAEHTQYVEYDGSAKRPEFKVVDHDGREVTAGYWISIYSYVASSTVDAAIEPGRYTFDLEIDEPGYHDEYDSITLLITRPWTLDLKEASQKKTKDYFYPEFTAKVNNTEIPEYDGSEKLSFDTNIYDVKKDGKEVDWFEGSGTYTFKVDAWVYDPSAEAGYRWDYYTEIEGKEFTLTLTDNWSLDLTTSTVSITNAELPISEADLFAKLKFAAKDKDGKEIPLKDGTAQNLYFEITSFDFYDYDTEDYVYGYVTHPGIYDVEVTASCGGPEWSSDYYTKNDIFLKFTLTVTP